MHKSILWVLGIVLILVGLLGFFNDPILGIFEVDTIHNIIHLVSGILALAVAGKKDQAMMFCKVFGIVYLLVAIIGFVQGDTVLGIISINGADNILHIVLAVVFIYLGFSGKGASKPTSVAQ